MEVTKDVLFTIFTRCKIVKNTSWVFLFTEYSPDISAGDILKYISYFSREEVFTIKPSLPVYAKTAVFSSHELFVWIFSID